MCPPLREFTIEFTHDGRRKKQNKIEKKRGEKTDLLKYALRALYF